MFFFSETTALTISRQKNYIQAQLFSAYAHIIQAKGRQEKIVFLSATTARKKYVAE